MVKTRVRVFILLGLVLGAAPSPAGACVCYESEGMATDFRNAAAVFAGRVVALEVAESAAGEHVSEEMVATLKVERRWKGPKKDLVRVRTCGTQTSVCTCGTDFQLGARFIIFAVDEPLATGSCQRTRAYTSVKDEPAHQWLGAEDLVRELDAHTKKSGR